MNLKKLAERSAEVLREHPEWGDLPVFVSRNKSRRTTEYISVDNLFGCRMKIAETVMIQLSGGRKVLVWDCSKGLRA